jgi:branched-chain amino acid transport system ATP-binding protein
MQDCRRSALAYPGQAGDIGGVPFVIILQANIPEAGYGKKIVLRDISLEIEEGTIVGFIGPNGAGKSTLLKALIGIVQVASGEIYFDSLNISRLRTEERVARGLSFVPQGNRVFTELSVRENIELGGYLLPNRSVVVKRMESSLQLFPELRDKLKRTAGQLSGGEKQQLALCRALMLEPKLLMLDEPSLGLAPNLLTHAFDTIKAINAKFGTTILIVEQKVRELFRIAQKVHALRMGQIVFSGTPVELQQGDTMKRIFLV